MKILSAEYQSKSQDIITKLFFVLFLLVGGGGVEEGC